MSARLLSALFCLLLLSACAAENDSRRMPVTTTGDTVHIHRGGTIAPEGTLGAGEWADADTVLLRAGASAQVTVLVKHDSANLLVRFSGVKPGSTEYYPVLLLDGAYGRDTVWQSDDFMLEVTYQDCEAWGHPDSQVCAPLRKGWYANNFPTEVPGVIELKVAGEFIGIDPAAGATIGLAFGVRSPGGGLILWPETAVLDRPDSWATAVFHTK